MSVHSKSLMEAGNVYSQTIMMTKGEILGWDGEVEETPEAKRGRTSLPRLFRAPQQLAKHSNSVAMCSPRPYPAIPKALQRRVNLPEKTRLVYRISTLRSARHLFPI
jgi:hypothetical protein